jgi:hypothetical protein
MNFDCTYLGEIYIDINGPDKKPNRYGYDRFRFGLAADGRLYPYGGMETAVKERGSNYTQAYWKTYKNQNKTVPEEYRTAQLMEEGWKMNYEFGRTCIISMLDINKPYGYN